MRTSLRKQLEQRFILVGFLGQELERHRLAESQIIGAINLAHAASAQQGDDAITTGQKPARKKAALIRGAAGRAQLFHHRPARAFSGLSEPR